MKKAVFLNLTLFTILFCNTAYAARPLSTEDARVAAQGKAEFEFGTEHSRIDNKDNSHTFTAVPILGITENLEFSVEIPFSILRLEDETNEEGIEDIQLVLKTLLLPETERRPSILFKTSVKLAAGDRERGLGSGDEDVLLLLAATKTIGPVTLHLNSGYTFVGKEKDETLNNYLIYAGALELAVNPKLSIVGEVYAEGDSHYDTGAFGHHGINPLFGLTYALTEKIRLDCAFKTNFHSGKKTDYSLIGGVSLTF